MKVVNKNKDELAFDTVENTSMYYMHDQIESIKKLEIRDFNYVIFEEDLDNMYKTEFEKFFNEYVIEMIESLSEYLAIDVDYIEQEPYRIKLLFTKNIVRFIMNTLPYIFIKEYLATKNIDGLHDALDELEENIVDKLIGQINISQSEYDSFNALMSNVSSTITNDKKKANFESKLSLLEITLSSKEKLLDYYKLVISNSGNDGLKALVKKYLLNDLDNIV